MESLSANWSNWLTDNWSYISQNSNLKNQIKLDFSVEITRYKLLNNEEKTHNKEISVQNATEMSHMMGHFIQENF